MDALAAETRVPSGNSTIAGPCPLESIVKMPTLFATIPWTTAALVWPLYVTVNIGEAVVGRGVFEGSNAAT